MFCLNDRKCEEAVSASGNATSVLGHTGRGYNDTGRRVSIAESFSGTKRRVQRELLEREQAVLSQLGDHGPPMNIRRDAD